MRRALRIARNLALGLLGLPLLLLIAANSILLTARGRDFVRVRAEHLASDALGAQLKIAHLDALSIFGLRVRGVQLTTQQGQTLLSASQIQASLEPFALLTKRVRVVNLELQDPFVDLGAPLDGTDGLSGLLSKQASEKEPATDSGAGFDIAIDHLDLRGADILATLADARWEVSSFDAVGSLEVARGFAVGVERLHAQFTRNGEPVGAIEQAGGRYRPEGSTLQLSMQIADTRLEAEGSLGPADPSAPAPVALRVSARAIDANTLSVLGIREPVLRTPIDLTADVRGDTRAASASVTLDAGDAGSLRSQLGFHAPLLVQAELQTDGIEPSQLLETELGALAGRVALRLERANPRAPFELAAEVHDARYTGIPLPETEAKGRYDDERGLNIDHFTARSGEVQLQGRGALDRQGAVSLHAELSGRDLASSPALQRVAPGLRGALEANAHVERAATGMLELEFHAAVARAAVGSARLGALKLDGSGSGKTLANGHARAELEFDALHVGKVAVEHASASLYGAHGVFTLLGRFDPRGELLAQARHHEHDWTVNASLELPARPGEHEEDVRFQTVRFETSEASEPELTRRMVAESTTGAKDARPGIVRVQLEQLRLESSGRIVLPSLAVRYEDARAILSGSLSAQKRLALRAALSVPRLSAPTELLLEQPLHGTVQLNAEANGTLEKPQLKVVGSYRCPNVGGLRNVLLGLEAATDPAENSARASVNLHATGTAVRADVQIKARALSAAALHRASYQVALNVDRFPLHALERWPRAPAVPNYAVLHGSASAQGTVESYALATAFDLKARFAQQDAPITTSLEASYAQKKLALALRVEDKAGPLFRSALHTELAGPRIVLDRTSLSRLLVEHAWDASAWLAARRVDQLPALRALGVPSALWPAQVALDAELKHQPGTEPQGNFSASALWKQDPNQRRARSCAHGGDAPYATFKASMKEGAVDIWAGAGTGDHESVTASFSSNAPIDSWLQVEPERVPPVTIDASFTQLQLADLPLVCEHARGSLDGKARLVRGLTSAVDVSAALHGSALRFLDSQPIDVVVSAETQGERLLAHGKLSAPGGDAQLSAELPLDRKGRVPSLRTDAPLVADVRFHQVPAPALMAPVPGVQATTGKIDGFIDVRGTLVDPALRGRIDLADVTAVLGQLGQRFERASGSILIDGRTVRMPELHFADMQGHAKASGELTVNSMQPLALDAKLQLETDQLPVRREGVLVAHLTANAAAGIRIANERVDIDASLRKARIELTDDVTANVQPLAADPNIIFAHANPLTEQAPDQSSALHVHIAAPEPFWVRRSDFSALVTSDLTLEARAGGEPPSVVGTIKVERGVVELLGTMFDIEQGTIEFSGGHAIEPTLNLSATRRIQGGSGGVVRVEAQGAIHDLKLTFEIDGRTVTAGDALAAALGTHASPGGGEDVKQQLGSIATGLAGSMLTLAARRELGPWVPVLALERGAGETRVRAGVEADRFIPKFLRRVVVDAYVEGIFTAEDQSDGAQVTHTNNAGAAVLLELRLPHNLSTEALYGPGDRWALDLGWEP